MASSCFAFADLLIYTFCHWSSYSPEGVSGAIFVWLIYLSNLVFKAIMACGISMNALKGNMFWSISLYLFLFSFSLFYLHVFLKLLFACFFEITICMSLNVKLCRFIILSVCGWDAAFHLCIMRSLVTMRFSLSYFSLEKYLVLHFTFNNLYQLRRSLLIVIHVGPLNKL